jgi:hypothetical protein
MNAIANDFVFTNDLLLRPSVYIAALAAARAVQSRVIDSQIVQEFWILRGYPI